MVPKIRSRTTVFFIFPTILTLFSSGCGAAGTAPTIGQTVEQAFPGLASISLGQAVLAKLPTGVLLRSGNVSIKAKVIDAEIAKAPQDVRAQLKKNSFFVMEQMATGKILAKIAREQAASAGYDISIKKDNEVIQQYFDNLTSTIAVSDSEVTDFYQQNKDACGGATLEQMRDQLKQYVLQQKKQEFVSNHVRGLGTITKIEVASSWIKAQAVLARDNSVDKARSSGKPTMVDFGADGCRPCDMMASILEELKTEYAGKANVLFVHVRQEQILATRFGIQSIPVQVFFDATGKEVNRHVGFYPKDEILKQLRSLGVE
jgi:thiol-disulfide isomerase/thioredoxin